MSANLQPEHRPIQSWQDWFTPGRFALLLGAMTFAAFPQVVLGFHTLIYRDFGLFSYPLVHYQRESFWRGEIPLWNPYNNFGIPFLAQWGTMVLYPPSLIYLLLPLPWSLGLFCLLHLLFGGMGMYVLARRWTRNSFAAALAGVGFAFNGLTLNCLMWPHYTASVAWMPWVVWIVLRACREGGRWTIYAALVGAMQMLSGTPEVILFTWLLVAGLFLTDAGASLKQLGAPALRLAAIIVLVALLGAAQLLPFFQLLAHSTRSSNFALDQWPIPISGWANIFVPLFRTHRSDCGVHFQDGQGFTSSYYPGLMLIALAIGALLWRRERRVWLLWCLIVVGFVLAMGHQTPLYDLLRQVFPPVGFMRYASKFLIFTMFAWPVLAALGWVALAAQPVALAAGHRWRVQIGVFIAAAITVTAIVIFARIAPHPTENWLTTLRNGAERLGLLALLAAMMGWALRSVPVKPLFAAAILLVLWFDFLTHVPTQNPTAPVAALTAKAPHLEQMQPRPRLGESRALLTLRAIETFHKPGTSNLTETYLVLRSGLYGNCNLIAGIPKADGFFAMYLREERDIHFRLYEDDSRPRAELGRFLGISQVSGESNVLAWHPRSEFLPLITAGQRAAFALPEETLDQLLTTNFNPAHIVYLPPAAQNQVRVDRPHAARVISTRVARHRIDAEVEASSPSVVVVSQIHYPAWRAYVDGKPARLWRANHAFQALYIPSGAHSIRWAYEDTLFWLGALLSTITLGGCAAALWASRLGTRPAPIQDIGTPINQSRFRIGRFRA